MSSIVVLGDTSGGVTLSAPAVAGTVTVTLPATSGTMAVSGASQSFTDVAATGNLTVDGNTILGNASTDTLNVGNGGLVKDASGNVGIGTSSPNASYKMSITGNSASIYSGILFTDTNAGGGVFSIYGESAALKFRDSSAGATRMTIDSSGRTITPYQPAFAGRGSTAGWAVSTTDATVPYNLATFNVGSNFNTSTYTFTAPVAGVYFVSFSALIYPTSLPAGVYITMYVSINNGNYVTSSPMARRPFTEAQTTMASAGLVSVSANDTISIKAGAVSAGYSLYLLDGHAHFSVYFLG